MRIEEKLNKEIMDELDELEAMSLGSDEYKTTVDCIVKLADRSIEMRKVEADIIHKTTVNEQDSELKKQQIEDEKKDRKIKNLMTGLGVVLPLAVTVWGTIVSLNFEKTGTVTTGIGRGFINKLLPKNK